MEICDVIVKLGYNEITALTNKTEATFLVPAEIFTVITNSRL
jgi:hypothetical protein